MFSPNIWGPHFWHLLHNVSILCPETLSEIDQQMFYKIISSYKYLLPCDSCKKHYINKFDESPIFQITNTHKKVIKEDIIMWCVKMHNKVNRMLMKKVLITDDVFGVDYVKNKYKNGNIILLLKTVMKYALHKKTELTENECVAFSDLFNGVAYFLSFYKIDLIKNMKMKNISLNFASLLDVTKFISALN